MKSSEIRQEGMIDYGFLPRDRTPSELEVAEVTSLIPQLTPHAGAVSQEAFTTVTRGSRVLVARDRRAGGRIVGIVCLVPLVLPSGLKGTIEDLVVDQEYRGRGIGEQLMRRLLDEARRLGLRLVMLTSRPSREAANRLHRRLGFQLRDTNCYHLVISSHGMEVRAS